MDPPPDSPPSRSHRIAAGLVVLLLLAALARSAMRRPPRSDVPAAAEPPRSDAPPSAAAPAKAPPARAGPTLRFEVQAEVAVRESGPPVRLRLRPRDGAQRPFDFTTREEPAQTHFALQVALPVDQPELPLRCEIVGDDWCVPPGLLEFEIARLDSPTQLVLARARRFEVLVRNDQEQPVAAVRLVHESGRELGRTAADGRARLVLPARAKGEAVVAQAEGFAPTLVDADGKSVVLRRRAAMGLLHGVVRDAAGAAVAGAAVLQRWFPGGAVPGTSTAASDVAARGLWRLAERTRERPLPALAQTSGADGGFEVALPFPGRVIVTATHRDLGRASLTLDLAVDAAVAGARTEAELRFPRQVALTVDVTLDGAPAPRCVVEVVHPDAADPTLLAAGTTDAKGQIVLAVPELPPLFVVLRADGAAPRVVDFDAQGRATASLAATLDRGRAVAFTLTGGDGLEPAAQIVEARDVASHALLATATTDGHGRGRFTHLPAARAFDLAVPALGGDAPPLAKALLLESAATATEVELGALPMKRE